MSSDFSEKNVPTTDGVLREHKTIFHEDSSTETIIAHGTCSGCGLVNPSSFYLCQHGDLVCKECVIRYEGRVFCRKHLEENVGKKFEAMVGIGISLKLGKGTIKKFAAMTDDEVVLAKQGLEERGYVKSRNFGLVGNSVKLTARGLSAIRSLHLAYREDNDMRLFMQRVQEEKPDWKELLGVT